MNFYKILENHAKKLVRLIAIQRLSVAGSNILTDRYYRREAKINANKIYGTFEKFIKGFKDTLDKLSADATKVITFGLSRSKDHGFNR